MARNDGIDRTVARNQDLETPADVAKVQEHNEREKDSYGRTESAAYRTATTQRPSSFRTSTISFPKTKIRRQSLRVGVISSIILTARFIFSCLF